jgi:hypothetical protein
MKTKTSPAKTADPQITFDDCVDSVRFEIEDALKRFPENKELFLHQVRLILDKLAASE